MCDRLPSATLGGESAAKCANAFATAALNDYFMPHQLGVGVSGGCEAAIHAH